GERVRAYRPCAARRVDLVGGDGEDVGRAGEREPGRARRRVEVENGVVVVRHEQVLTGARVVVAAKDGEGAGFRPHRGAGGDVDCPQALVRRVAARAPLFVKLRVHDADLDVAQVVRLLQAGRPHRLARLDV